MVTVKYYAPSFTTADIYYICIYIYVCVYFVFIYVLATIFCFPYGHGGYGKISTRIFYNVLASLVTYMYDYSSVDENSMLINAISVIIPRHHDRYISCEENKDTF